MLISFASFASFISCTILHMMEHTHVPRRRSWIQYLLISQMRLWIQCLWSLSLTHQSQIEDKMLMLMLMLMLIVLVMMMVIVPEWKPSGRMCLGFRNVWTGPSLCNSPYCHHHHLRCCEKPKHEDFWTRATIFILSTSDHYYHHHLCHHLLCFQHRYRRHKRQSKAQRSKSIRSWGPEGPPKLLAFLIDLIKLNPSIKLCFVPESIPLPALGGGNTNFQE